MTMAYKDIIIVWRPRQRRRVALKDSPNLRPCPRTRIRSVGRDIGEETLNFVEKASSSLTGTSDDVDRKWRRSSMPHGVVEYEPQSSKRSSRCDLTCIVPASAGDMRALCTVWPFIPRQGPSREGLEIAAGYSTLPRRAHFQTCLRPAPVSCINISEKLMRRT